MGASRRVRHRDREPGRDDEETNVVARHRHFRLTGDERQEIARALRYIDEARQAIEAQRNPDNREIIRELKASADRIFDLLSHLEEIDVESATT